MGKNYRRKYRKEDDFDKLVQGLSSLYVIYLFLLWFFDRERFYRWLIYGLIIFALLILGMFLYYKIKRDLREKKKEKVINIIKEANLEKYINDFISNYGLGNQEKKEKSWNYRDYSFAKYRINDLNKYLKLRNIVFSDQDIVLLLKEYIEEREFKKMEMSSELKNYYFNDINGKDFENLLYRLYEKMGYEIQLTGKSGDQGADLIVAKGKNRIAIQAKCYKNNLVNNKAIQEAVASKGIYNCNIATVVTNSDFTSGAIELAKANNVYLINGKKLKELLLYYLKENWV